MSKTPFLILALALALLAPKAAAARNCAEALPSACLRNFGAGVLAQADDADCARKLDEYRDCIAAVAQRVDAAPSAAPLSRSERGFLSALEAELADNVGRLATFIEGLDLTGRQAVYETDWPRLRLRFFDATDNPAYFAAPADWLARTQGFYDEIGRELAREDVRQAFRRTSTSVLYDRRLAKERLLSMIGLGRDRLLPEISAVLAADAR